MASSQDPLIGQTVGEYRIVSLIGEGGMGVVYAAEHRTLGNKTAIKVLRREMMSQKDATARFLQEARLISRIRHVNLIDIFDIGELEGGSQYYIMEYLQGRSLSQRMQAGRLPLAEITSLMRQLCAGLAAAHAVGIVHRDLKPDNIFIVEKPGAAPLLKIVDFGIAKVMGIEPAQQVKLTSTGTLIGTPHYMAPEQINGQSIDARTDIYAVGVILYQLCTQRLPFPGDTLGEILIGHLQQSVPVLDDATLKHGVPAGLQDLLAKAMAKSKEQRYESIAALSADLDRVLRGETSLAGRSRLSSLGLPTQPVARPGKRRLVLTLLLMLGVAAIGGTGAYLYKRRSGPQQVVAPDMVALRSLALKVLQEGLADGDPAVRKQAVKSLAESRDARHRTLLEQRLHDPDPAVQVAAARALGELGSRASLPALLTRLEEPTEPALQASGGEALLRLGDQAAKKYLQLAQKAQHFPTLQLQAAVALSETGDKEAQQLVSDRLSKLRAPDEETLLLLGRRARQGDTAALTLLQGLLPREGMMSSQQQRVAGLLSSLGDERATTLLSQVLSQPGPQQVAAAQLLCAADDISGQPVLRQALSNSSRPISDRLLAAQGIGSCGDKQDAARLGQALGSPREATTSPLLRQVQAGALLKLCNGDPVVLAEQSVGWAEQALTDEDWNVRAAAVAALGELSERESTAAMPLLRKAMHDQRSEVRKLAAEALSTGRSPDALAMLGDALKDTDKDVRMAALHGIAQVGRKLQASPGGAAAQAGMQTMLRDRATTDASEKMATASALLAMGDSSQRAEVRAALLGSGKTNLQEDPTVAAMAVEAAGHDPELRGSTLPQLLNDQAAPFATRLRAAIELAGRGDKASVGLLREALQKGGPDGLLAASALRKLGEPVSAEQSQPGSMLQSSDIEMRRAAVAALSTLPPKDAVPLLMKATRDSSRVVRGQVAETAAELPQGPQGRYGLPVLRTLLDDVDAGLRTRAAALLARLLREATPTTEAAPAPTKPTEPSPVPTPKPTGSDSAHKPTATEPGPGKTEKEPVAEAHKEGRGFLVVEAPATLAFQIDKQTVASKPGKPIPVSAGEHRITYEGGQQVVAVAEGETVTVQLAASQVAALVKAGIEAYERKDYKRAKKALEKASSLCSRRREERATCISLGFELSLHFAKVLEAQEAWAEAMTEYEKILQPGFVGKVKPDGRAQVQEAVRRLAPRLGKLRVSKIVKGECQTVELWMPPGRHRVNVGGGQFVQVRAKETSEVKGCP
jgi:HEAT repeat protein/tRNA A-37 threonylcarbamoyl transferase component Bud32